MVHHAPQSAQKPQIVPKKLDGDGHTSARAVTPAVSRNIEKNIKHGIKV